jgi:hypothetical protein
VKYDASLINEEEDGSVTSVGEIRRLINRHFSEKNFCWTNYYFCFLLMSINYRLKAIDLSFLKLKIKLMVIVKI